MAKGEIIMSLWRKRNGKILKVRMGYNANSSSIAAVVTYFLWGAAASVIVINMFAAVIFSKNTKPDTGKEKDAPEEHSV